MIFILLIENRHQWTIKWTANRHDGIICVKAYINQMSVYQLWPGGVRFPNGEVQLMRKWRVGAILKNQVGYFQLLREFLEDQGHCSIFQSTRDCKGTSSKRIAKVNERYGGQEENLSIYFCRPHTMSMKLSATKSLPLNCQFSLTEENSSVSAQGKSSSSSPEGLLPTSLLNRRHSW